MSAPDPSGAREASFRDVFTPKLITCLREGYRFETFRHDFIAGLTVAIVALPLAIALAIASGTPPERGLYTAVTAGFLISFLGGSRFQIGGPTGAFVAVVFGVIERHGYDGLVIATIASGILLMILGLSRLGSLIKYFPYPVVTGFTAGIAVLIFSSQIKDLLGLQVMGDLPGAFIPKLQALWAALGTFSPHAAGLSCGTLIALVLLRRLFPKFPSILFVVAGAAVVVWWFELPVATIHSTFGEVPNRLPAPSIPTISLEKLRELFPDIITITFLAGVESLLSAVIADSIAGTRHRSNCELVAQGVANVVSPIFGGLPATGAIARTVTNIKAGGRTPVAGILHAVLLLGFMMGMSPLLRWFPLASLAAVLALVAWNMSEVEKFRALLRAPRGDRVVLVLTFVLTVVMDLTVGVTVGIVLGALLFMQRMSAATEVVTQDRLIDSDIADVRRRPDQLEFNNEALPPAVEVLRISGPFFFGAAWRLGDVLTQIRESPKVLIVDLSQVPFIDATGSHALNRLVEKSHRRGARVLFAGASSHTRRLILRLAPENGEAGGEFVVDFEAAAVRARELVGA